MSVQKQIKKLPKLKAATSEKLFKACQTNDLRKSYNKLWVDVKEDTLPIVEAFGGFTVGKHKGHEFSLEILKKNTTRFDIKSFKEKHPEIYDQFLIGGESVELKTKYKKV
tara:strand:+ start:1202 stop:1531 length:330 start_codon:yes stop_codon:yes gene_type:complete